MTAFVISYSRNRLIIAADTLGYVPDRVDTKPLGYITKIYPIVHLKAVVFGRGMLQIPGVAALRMNLSPHVRSLEDAAEAMPEALRDATAVYAQENGIEDPADYGIAEVAFAGWSAAEKRMKIWYYFNGDDYAPKDDSGIRYGLLTMPPIPDMPEISGSIDRQLVKAMHMEQQFFRENAEAMGGARLGGEIQAWTITNEGIAQRVLHRFNDYESQLHAGAAVAERIIRGDLQVDIAEGLTPIGDMQDVSRAERRRAEKAARKGRRAA